MEYETSITITLTVRAASQSQAEERTEKVALAALEGIARLGSKPWLGDPEYEAEIREETP